MENSAKCRCKEVTWGTSALSNAQFLLRSVCVGNREDIFLVKIINNMWPFTGKRTLTTFRFRTEFRCKQFKKNLHPFKRLIHLFGRNVQLFERLGHPFEKNIHPFERLRHPFSKNINPFEQLGHPFGKNIQPFEQLGHQFGENIQPFEQSDCWKQPSVLTTWVIHPTTSIILSAKKKKYLGVYKQQKSNGSSVQMPL